MRWVINYCKTNGLCTQIGNFRFAIFEKKYRKIFQCVIYSVFYPSVFYLALNEQASELSYLMNVMNK